MQNEEHKPFATAMLIEVQTRNVKKDIKAAAKKMGREEARMLVSMYYSAQEDRKRQGNRLTAMAKEGIPTTEIPTFLLDQSSAIEEMCKVALDVYSANDPVGEWMRSNYGIGPVIAAGILAHIDPTRLKHRSSLFQYAGLNPTMVWEKGQKRPFNAELKRLMWLIGESFVKVSGKEAAFYGQLYRQRHAYECRNNEAGKYADQAAKQLGTKNFTVKEAIAILKSGKLLQAHINERAKRYVAKRFLSDLYVVMWEHHNKSAAPLPYIISIGGHSDYDPPPLYKSPYPKPTLSHGLIAPDAAFTEEA